MGENVLQEKDFEYAKDRGGVTIFNVQFEGRSTESCHIK